LHLYVKLSEGLQIKFRCEICKVDTPCPHQIDEVRTKAWLADLEREKTYSEFLHINDFETWQPFCYMDQDTELRRVGAIAAQREFIRALWILNRFNQFQSPAWYRLTDKIHENWRVLQQMIESNEKINYWNEELNGQ
jgi:hypothetical protein